MPDFGSDTASFENVRCLKQNDAGTAILVQLEDRDAPVWFPQGAVDDDSEVYKTGHEGTLIVWEKIAIEKGLV